LTNAASATVTIVVTPGAGAVGTLSNTASVTSAVTDPNTSNNSWTTTTTVNAAANLSITKTDSPDPILVGQNLTYTITVTNNGPSSATGVSMTDTLPGGVNFVSVTPGSPTCTQASGIVSCNLGTLANGATSTVTIVVTPTVAGTINNTASVTSGVADPVSGNDSATTSTTVSGLSADLAINKTVSNGTVYVGQNFTYTITVTNLGPNSATGVSVSDTLPAGVSYVSATPSQGSPCTGTSTVSCTLGTLGNGASATVTIVVTATATGAVTNTATASSGVTDPNSGNNSGSVSKTISAQADLSITKTDSPDPVVVGGTLTYTITVTNNGPNSATGVTVTDTRPAATTFVSATSSQGSCSGTTTITCALGTLAFPGSATVTIVVTPTTAGTLSNTASVSSTTTDPVPGNNTTAPVTTTVNPATVLIDLEVTQTAAPSPVQVGLPVTYTITVTNNGPGTATGVTVTDTLPTTPANTFNSVTPSQGSCTAPSGGTFTCSLGTLINGGSATITLILTPLAQGMIGNTVAVAGNESESTTVNNSASAAANVGDVSRLINISTRARVLTVDNVMIGGFIVGGNVPKQLLVRGRGPSLGGAPFNIPGSLSNPTIQLFSGATLIAQNDNFGTFDATCVSPCTAVNQVTSLSAPGYTPCDPNPGQTSAPPGCSQEAAVLVTMPPGAYTVILSGVGGGTGVGLIEVFDIDGSTFPKLVNISTRARVETGNNVMIGGFIVGAGAGNKQILMRARGPSMSGAPFNIAGTLSNPTIELYSGATVIAQNDDWQTTNPLCGTPAVACGNATAISATIMDPCQPNPGQSVAPPGCAQEAALLVTVPPGAYTMIVRGVGGGTGVGLVEIFDLSP
jgi:uncharacterized repeat protein (TIGR01451 family)